MRQGRIPRSDSSARVCSGLGCVSSSNSVCHLPVWLWARQTERVTVARTSRSVRKLSSGVPSAARCVACFRFALASGSANAPGSRVRRLRTDVAEFRQRAREADRSSTPSARRWPSPPISRDSAGGYPDSSDHPAFPFQLPRIGCGCDSERTEVAAGSRGTCGDALQNRAAPTIRYSHLISRDPGKLLNE